MYVEVVFAESFIQHLKPKHLLHIFAYKSTLVLSSQRLLFSDHPVKEIMYMGLSEKGDGSGRLKTTLHGQELDGHQSRTMGIHTVTPIRTPIVGWTIIAYTVAHLPEYSMF